MKISSCLLTAIAFTIFSCNTPSPPGQTSETSDAVAEQKYHKYHSDHLFPGDGSLLRAEDGVALPDGRLVVVDQAHGLRMIEENGESRPFGDFPAAGYEHNPPEIIAAPNGMVLEHDGTHILVSDVSNGKLYRVDIQSEEVAMFYDHPYGVNTLYRDRTGAIWFTQSTVSTNMNELFRDVNLPVPGGAVYRMDDLGAEPVKMVDSLYFANGITMDRAEKYLFVAETMMDRIHMYGIDINNGVIESEELVVNIPTPDNVVVDDNGRLIAALPLFNQVVAVDLEQRSTTVLFDGSTPENRKISQEWVRRSHLGMERLELFTPDLFHPLPGLITGMFFSADYKTLYISNLGNDLLKYPWR